MLLALVVVGLGIAIGLLAVSALVPVGERPAKQALGGLVEPFPAASQVARPLKALNAMPVTVLPSSPTNLAGTSRRTQPPAAGKGPMNRRPSVPATP